MSINDYSSFGPIGPYYEEFFKDARGVARRCTETSAEPYSLSRNGIWMPSATPFDQLEGAGNNLLRTLYFTETSKQMLEAHDRPGDFDAFIALLNLSFAPVIEVARLQDDFLSLHSRVKETLATADDSLRQRWNALCNICYGPFSGLELEYIRTNHTRILEVGCGTGYLIWVLRSLGIDAVGFDNHSHYTDGWKDECQRTLVRQSALHTGSTELIERLCEKRSLLISFPSARARYVTDALQSYTDCGGQTLLLKIGAFMGRYPKTRPRGMEISAKTFDNVYSFFQLLGSHWKEVATDLPISWLQDGNYLQVFQRG